MKKNIFELNDCRQSEKINFQKKIEKEKKEAEIIQGMRAEEVKDSLIKIGLEKEALAFEKVKFFSKEIEKAGGRAFLVGGAVRDELLGEVPKDFDVEVYGLEPGKIQKIASKFFQKAKDVGVSFGILKVRTDEEVDIDISLPRKESKIGRGHKDFAVNADPFMSLKEASRRRDFTFNALMKDVVSGEIYDFFGGIKDIQNRILRVTDEERFKDDPLRVLRGAQFVGRFGLKVEDRTAGIMREIRDELEFLAKERIKEEWLKLFLKSEKPSLGLQAAMEWGIFHKLHPELVDLLKTPQDSKWHPEGNVWIHTLMVVDEAAKIIRERKIQDKDAIVIMLAAFCHDFGKPYTTIKKDNSIVSPGHEKAGEIPTKKFLSQIGIPLALQRKIINLVTNHLKPTLLYKSELRGEKVSDGAIRKLALRIFPATIEELVLVSQADQQGRGPFINSHESGKCFITLDYPTGKWLLERANKIGVYKEKPKPIIMGRDLINLGFHPGVLFGKVISLAEELSVAGLNREEILLKITQKKGEPLEEVIKTLRKLLAEKKKKKKKSKKRK